MNCPNRKRSWPRSWKKSERAAGVVRVLLGGRRFRCPTLNEVEVFLFEDAKNKIRLRAYAIWEREGRPDGRHIEHWFLAQREIEQETAQAPAASAISGGESRGEQSSMLPTSPHPAIFQSV